MTEREYLIDRKNAEIARFKEHIKKLESDFDKDMRFVYLAETLLFFIGVGAGCLISALIP